jgi:hypothetical protein
MVRDDDLRKRCADPILPAARRIRRAAGALPDRRRAPALRRPRAGHTFVEWAGGTIPRCFWAKAYCDRKRASEASYNASLRALAFKWVRVLFRCWVDRVPYDESQCLSALQKRGSPVLKSAAEATS